MGRLPWRGSPPPTDGSCRVFRPGAACQRKGLTELLAIQDVPRPRPRDPAIDRLRVPIGASEFGEPTVQLGRCKCAARLDAKDRDAEQIPDHHL